MLKTKKRNRYTKGRIESMNKDYVVISVDDGTVYKKGERVRATVSTNIKTALGKSINVPEVIAHGFISDVSGKKVTIRSKSSNPIISKNALQIAKKPTEVNMKSLQ